MLSLSFAPPSGGQLRRPSPDDPAITVAVGLAAWASGVESGAILAASRGEAPIACARQLAVYLAHVVLGYDLTRLSQVFRRDRATLRHALRRVEDDRDDPEFDRRVARLEAILMPLRAISSPEGGR